MCFQRRALYLYLFERNAFSSRGLVDLNQFLASTFGDDNPSIKAASVKLQQSFLPKLRARWKTCRRIKARFEEKNDKWLHVVECLDIPVVRRQRRTSTRPEGAAAGLLCHSGRRAGGRSSRRRPSCAAQPRLPSWCFRRLRRAPGGTAPGGTAWRRPALPGGAVC